MRTLDTGIIREKLEELILRTLTRVTPEAEAALAAAAAEEENPNAAFALDVINRNIRIAGEKDRPLCQDTGMAVVFAEIGQDVRLTGGLLSDAVNAAVRNAYRKGCFRMSVLDPLTRVNTGDNTPAVLHTEPVGGEGVRIRFLPKGFGSENMTRLYCLTPAAGRQGVVDSVLDAVKRAGSSPCPPVVLGVGIGGTADMACLIAKKALLRPVGQPSERPDVAELEAELLEKINALGIGAQGFGGKHTALSVAAETYPTHIAGLPVCVLLQCHAVRAGEVRL